MGPCRLLVWTSWSDWNEEKRVATKDGLRVQRWTGEATMVSSSSFLLLFFPVKNKKRSNYITDVLRERVIRFIGL